MKFGNGLIAAMNVGSQLFGMKGCPFIAGLPSLVENFLA